MPGLQIPVGIERAAEAFEHLQVALGEHPRHRAGLVHADAVLAGERAARLEAGVEDGLGELARALGLTRLRVVQDERVEIAVPRMEDVPDAQPVPLRQRLDLAQHLGQPRARDDAVLHVVVGRDPPHRGEGRLAPLPEEGAGGVVRGRPELEGAALAADALHLGRVVLDLLGDAVELDEEHGARAVRVARRDRALGGLDRQAVHHLDRRRHDAGRDDARDGDARGVHRLEAGEEGSDGLRRADDAERDARGDPECPLGSDEHAQEVGPVRVEGLAAELEDVAVRQHEGEARDVVDREAVLQAVCAARSSRRRCRRWCTPAGSRGRARRRSPRPRPRA